MECSGQIVVNLAGEKYDGVERWFTLGQRTPGGKENVSGDILLSFLKGGVPVGTIRKQRASNVIDELKSRLLEAQQSGGKILDLNACEMNKIPPVRKYSLFCSNPYRRFMKTSLML